MGRGVSYEIVCVMSGCEELLRDDKFAVGQIIGALQNDHPERGIFSLLLLLLLLLLFNSVSDGSGKRLRSANSPQSDHKSMVITAHEQNIICKNKRI